MLCVCVKCVVVGGDVCGDCCDCGGVFWVLFDVCVVLCVVEYVVCWCWCLFDVCVVVLSV